jgi:septum site-determining protein MinD
MGKIVSVHSFRGGTGKSNLVANLSASLALQGQRVGIIDTDIQSPGIHVLFGLNIKQITFTLNDYLMGRCDVDQAAYDVSSNLNNQLGRTLADSGMVYLIPSSMKVNEISSVLSEGYDVGLLTSGYGDLMSRLNLDYLLIDTHPGINEETLLSIGISDVLLVMMRPDHQDYQGTALTVKVARELDVSKMLLVINKVLPEFDFSQMKKEIEKTYQVPVAAVLPVCDEMIRLASQGLFCLHYPNHPLTQELHSIVHQLEP